MESSESPERRDVNKDKKFKGEKYIVAAIRPWNQCLFEEKILKFPGIWKLINRPDELTIDLVNQFKPRYIFFIHWSKRVPAEIIDNFECVCFHMTDLPYGRGATPLQNLIVRGHTQTTISAIQMVREIDAGPIYFKHSLSLQGNAEEIYIRSSGIAIDMIHKLIKTEPLPHPQKGKIVKFRPRCFPDSEIPSDANLRKIFDWIRMLDAEEYPPAFLDAGKFRIEFKRAVLRYNAIETNARIILAPSRKKNEKG